MDWSDEKSLPYGLLCPTSPDTMECADHTCLGLHWSCGDGQCIPQWDRLRFSEKQNYYCESKRELNYICETNMEWQLWTQPNGLCWNKPGYNDLVDLNNNSLSNTSKCIYLIRCALSRGFERDCPCDGSNCSKVMARVCRKNTMYGFPTGALFGPFMSNFYHWSRSWDETYPDNYKLNGSIRCRRFHGTLKNIWSNEWTPLLNSGALFLFDYLFCNDTNIQKDTESTLQYSQSCWKNSLTLNQRPYAVVDVCTLSRQCISQYRIQDGLYDCFFLEDERDLTKTGFCSEVRKHRLQCSAQQPSCLPINALGDGTETCINRRDEYVNGFGQWFFDIDCKQQDDDSCRLFKDYISPNSHISSTDNAVNTTEEGSGIPFRSYCDTHWNLPSHLDESPQYCRRWTCQHDQYQCQTGQCIPLKWVCDGQWDCSDASDEQAIFLIQHLAPHNSNIRNLLDRIEVCKKIYAKQSFSDICNVKTEFGCFRANVTNPLDIETNRPCINLIQIGDAIENCFGGYDEKNTFEDCAGAMLGFTLRYNNQQCIKYHSACGNQIEEFQDKVFCHYRSRNETCSEIYDVVCLDGSCKKDARCNQSFECSHGEDEYWCSFLPGDSNIISSNYRVLKRKRLPASPGLFVSAFPLVQSTKQDLQRTIQHSDLSSEAIEQMRVKTNDSTSFICNRGVAVSINGTTVQCFCPPFYYGHQCQYYHDRIAVITHLNLTSLSASQFGNNSRRFKVVVSLLYLEQIITFHQFDVDGEIEIGNYVKQKFYLLYSYSKEMKLFKQLRHLNRIDIIENRPYSVRFVVYELSTDQVKELGSWFYPILFDFLPVFHLATVLKFPLWYTNYTLHSCINNISCPQNSICQPNFNHQNPIFSCVCKSGYYGKECAILEPKCESYCSSDAWCQPKGRGMLTNTNNPLCICPLHRFGLRCNLRSGGCHSQPCLNNGSCQLEGDPSSEKSFVCNCSTHFYGSRCEHEKTVVHININMTSEALTSVFQFYDIHNITFLLLIQHQQVMKQLPTSIWYYHHHKQAPILGVLKLHNNVANITYFVVYIQQNVTTIRITSTPRACPHSSSFSLLQNETNDLAVFKYHQLCQKDKHLLCFHDDNYLCVCDIDHYRAECFGLNSSIDQCNFCFSGGKCVRGDLDVSDDFLCLCPKCSEGSRCEFSTTALGFTLDSLLATDSITIRILYGCLAALLFLIGLCSNTFSLITFQRPRPRTFGVGNYLYIVSILNQCSLFLVLLKFIHIAGGFGQQYSTNLNACKTISYLMMVLMRANYWLTSCVTLDRLLLIIFPTSMWLKNPRIAMKVSFAIIVTLAAMHVPEILSMTMVDGKCITHSDRPIITRYNRIGTLIHYLGPFTIQMIAITILIILAARSRVKAGGGGDASSFGEMFKKQLKTQKELYITPATIILSAIPHVISSFSLACSELSLWQRHTLLSVFLLSNAPQILGFVLFVIPSTEYKKEFQQTRIGQTNLFKWIFSPRERHAQRQ